MEWARLMEVVILGIMRGGMYSLMAVGLALVFGVMNIAQFAHGEFYMVGAYAAYYLAVEFGLNPFVAIVLAAGATFIVGVVIERVAFLPLRRRSQEWALNAFLLTAGVSFFLQNLALAILGPTYRGVTHYWEGVVHITSDFSVSMDRVISFGIAIAAIVGLWLMLYRTQTGRAIRAVAQDERGAELVGIILARIHLLTFGLSCALAGLAGASLLFLTQAYPSMGFRPLVQSWFVVMLVGLGNIPGAIVGGFIVGVIDSLSYAYLGSGWQDVVTVVVLIVILLVKPSGLFGSKVKGIWER